MKARYIEKDQALIKENEESDALYIVVYGLLQMRTEFDGNEFVVHNISQGTLVNHHNLLIDDKMSVSIVAAKSTRIMELTES